MLPDGRAKITAGASISTVFDRKFHAGDYVLSTQLHDNDDHRSPSHAEELLISLKLLD